MNNQITRDGRFSCATMPKDTWKRIRHRDRYGPLTYKQRNQSTGSRKSKVLQAAGNLTWDSAIWFGKHKGTKLRDLPKAYRQWLAGNLGGKGSHWLQAALRRFLEQNDT